MNKREFLSIYIHIPFCKSLCDYCDFPRVLYTCETTVSYIDSLVKEISHVSDELKSRKIKSIFIGGGTPSTLIPKQLRIIESVVFDNFNIDRTTEFSIEVNPEDVNIPLVQYLQESKINRISMGAQTFHAPENIGRRHTAKKIFESVNLIKSAGFTNFNLDLIFGLPQSTMETVLDDINTAIKLSPAHISFYGLGLENGTKMFEDVNSGKISIPGENKWVEMYNAGRDLLTEKGYLQYEISNFSKPQLECSHNMTYWTGGDYIGFGSGAASRINNLRWYNNFPPQNYIEKMKKFSWNKFPSIAVDTEILDPHEIFREKIMTGLRLTQGVDIYKTWRSPVLDFEIEKFIKKGSLSVSGNVVKLTKEGIAISDLIILDLISKIES